MCLEISFHTGIPGCIEIRALAHSVQIGTPVSAEPDRVRAAQLTVGRPTKSRRFRFKIEIEIENRQENEVSGYR
jgi:hypothetical protein